VKVIDTLDPNVTFVPGSVQVIDSQGVVTTPTNFTYNSTTRQLTGDLGYLLQQEQVTIKFNVTVNQNAPTAGTADLNNTVQVLSINDSNTANNTNTEATDVLAPVNRPPVDGNESVTTLEDTLITGNVLTNGSDPDNDSVTVTQFVVNNTTYTAGQTATLAGVGTLVIGSNGGYTFTPAANYNGSVPVATYTVSDGKGGSDTSTLTISVTPVNDPPVAVNDTLSGTEDTSLTITSDNLFGADGTGLNNDYDIDSANFSSITITTLATNGTLYLNGTAVTLNQVISATDIAANKLTFTPNANFNGAASFNYTVSDGALSSNVATVTISVAAVNDPPVDGNETVTTNEDSPATGNVLTNATDVDGDPLTVSTFTVAGDNTTYSAGQTATLAGVGTLVIGSNGDYSFTPAANYNGAVPVATYTVSDGKGGSDTSTLTISVTPVNDPPVAVNDTLSGTEDTSLTITSDNLFGADGTGLNNDYDIDSANFSSITITTLATNGTLYLNGTAVTLNQVISATDIAANKLTFTPNANFNGAASFNYTVSDGALSSNVATVTISVAAVNDPPVDGNETVTTNEDSPATGNVLTNATDVDGDPLTVSTFTVAGDNTTYSAGQTATLAGVGTLVIGSNGSYSFTPAANYNGAVPVATYTVSDGKGGSDTSTLTISVTPVNDPPVDGNETVTTNEDSPATGNVLTNATDVDGDPLTVSTFTVAGDNTTYSAGQTATLAGVGTLVIGSNGSYSFTPAANYNGAVPVATYTVSDGKGGSDTSTLTISVTPVNDPPVDGNETVTTNEDSPATGNVLTNATDVDGDPLTVSTFTVAGDNTTYSAGQTATLAGVGTLVIGSNGSYSFTPAANYNGAVPVATYTVSDGKGGSDTSTLTISVTPVNDPPVAVNDTLSGTEDTSLTITSDNLFGADGTGLNNDYDIDSASFSSIKVTTLATNGTLLLNGTAVTLNQVITAADIGNNKLTFTPNAI
jgi:D-Tyr-tRNAtyr deacylase